MSFNLRAVFIIAFCIAVQSCAIVNKNKSETSKQLGETLLHVHKQHSNLGREELEHMFKNGEISKQDLAFLQRDIALLNESLNTISTNKDLYLSLEVISANDHTHSKDILPLIFWMYPNEVNRLIEELESSEAFLHEDVERAALIARLDPSVAFEPTASGISGEKIVPLINSASITLYGFNEEIQNEVWFKESTDNVWQQGYPLQWEPVDGALSGSIVYLLPDTKYDVKVSYTYDGQNTERSYSFVTRPDSPPIDPDKIYYLSDLYSGGSFDLSAFDISGSEKGWAKIIGDGVVIDGDELTEAAFDIGDASYLLLENIVVKGGRNYGIHGDGAHHIWIDGCDVEQFGRKPYERRKGIAYESAEATTAINYDSGIFFRYSGVITIENCHVHNPNVAANHWGDGHPKGASALLLSAKHRNPEYQGQYIVRFNKFTGSHDNRFNDVIESRANVRRWGGFFRDSAIHDNFLAYANDDIMELDGGQSNVLVYNNYMTQAYCGISVAPNMQGPSYIFNNDIVDLGDQRDAQWAAIKMGGLFAAPSGKTLVFQNYIDVGAHGIAGAYLRGDKSFWTETRLNIIRLSSFRNQKRGYGLRDDEGYFLNHFKDDLIYNEVTKQAEVWLNQGNNQLDLYAPSESELELVSNKLLKQLDLKKVVPLPNFSSETKASPNTAQAIPVLSDAILEGFDTQDSAPKVLSKNDDQVTLSGNTWKSILLAQPLTNNAVISLDVDIDGTIEIVGLGLENDNRLSPERVFNLYGTQRFGNTALRKAEKTQRRLLFKPSDYVDGDINRLVLIVDNDSPELQTASVTFSNLEIFSDANEQSVSSTQAISDHIAVGMRRPTNED
ncbi:right-handed parallel beta-helix repeat-containing protein [Glaciecola siphonariae]|uniref:Right-handed parallel beta-helix repeat-containing protein n=1 Tax=Glaciecola siphonariae TaxID=521012 RepID=A0ABV9M1I1_9ALTE